MNSFDFSPLFRSTIGFDRLTRLVDAASRVDTAALAYPPYNIEKTGEDAYRLTMAVAGFSRDEVDVTVHENSLLVTGKSQKEDENGRYLHRGIARRAFERRFSLADHIKVVGASLDNGMLHVDLVHELPEAIPDVRVRRDALRDGTIRLAHLLVALGLAESNGEARRVIGQGGVSVDGKRLPQDAGRLVDEGWLASGDVEYPVRLRDGLVVRVGRRRFARVRLGE